MVEMNIIKIIQHKDQRYNTLGDYQEYLNNDVLFTISDFSNPDYSFLVSIHEQIEYYLCKKRGIEVTTIDQFDKHFEKTRAPDNFDEPGNSPDAPYNKEHLFATQIERLVATEIGVDWDKYEEACDKLSFPDTSFNFPASSDNGADDQC